MALTTACSGGERGDMAADAALGADAGPRYSDGDWLFEEERILEVEVEMPAASWDELRNATRNIFDILGEDCGLGPAPKVFSYLSARITIEGESFDEVGIRKKGFLGSLSDTKPSLKIKLDEFVSGQKMSGLSRFTFNNAVQDPSYLNQCIGYKLFRSAGIPAPRCNFATVTVNGERLGLFVHVEDIKKPFLRAQVGNDQGNLYEGTLSDFRAGWTATFEKKTNEAVLATPEVDELEAALLLDGDALRTALDSLIDVDAFLHFWAMETLLAHWDGYSGNNNNFFLYRDVDRGKSIFIPWGMDQLFGDVNQDVFAARTRSILPRKLLLHSASRSEYVAAMTEILDSTWDDNEVLAEIAGMEVLIRPMLASEEVAAFDQGLANLREAVSGREQAVRVQLASLGPSDAEDLMEPLCLAQSGTATGDFATTWRGTGTANMEVTIDGQALLYSQQSSVAVPDEETPGQALIAVFADLPDGSRTLLYLPLAEEELAPSSIQVAEGALLFYPPGSEEFDRVEFAVGILTLSQASAVEGAPIVGSFDFGLWTLPF